MKRSLWVILAACGLLGCTEEEFEPVNYGVSPEFTVTRLALDARCTVTVKGFGVKDMETDYVPNVTWCENGNSNTEGLRAQAVAARSFAYYKGNVEINNSQGDQVYNCPNRSPNSDQFARVLAATTATAGIVLRYKGTQLCAFYVAGVTMDNLKSDCTYSGSSTSGSQHFVTYNWGKSGTAADGHHQSTQGWVNDKNYANRGTMSQNGATCLGKKGWVWENIVKFFYGMDIEIVRASGSCITHPNCTTKIKASGGIVDDTDECFIRTVSNNWFVTNTGYGSSLQFAYVNGNSAAANGKWNLVLEKAGTYEVLAYVDQGVGSLTANAPYKIRAKGVEKDVKIKLAGKNGWVSLGKFDFAAGGDQWVKLTDATGEQYSASNQRVVFDAIQLSPASSCQDQCSHKDEHVCDGNGYKVCKDTNGDGCLEWTSVTACGANEKCANGACETVITCTNECDNSGERRCASDSGYQTCGNYDDDSCLDWSAAVICGAGQVCTDGECVLNATPITCQNECVEKDVECGDGGVRTCGQFDDDECFEWSQAAVCPPNSKCDRGECVEVSTGMEDTPTAECLTEIDGRPSTIIDEYDGCFEKSSSPMWSDLNGYGYEDHMYYAYIEDALTNAVGTWHLKVTKAGKYTIYAYVDGGIGSVAAYLPYTVRASGLTYRPSIATSGNGEWVNLGNYQLSVGNDQYVRMSDNASEYEPAEIGRRVVFDAIKVVPYQENAQPAPDLDPAPDSDSEYSPIVNASSSDCASSGLMRRSSGSIWLIGLIGALGIIGLRRRREM
ncbi:MAG: hypothetical protein IKY83_14830 [Proteobacteria bacterium]|nr:hypothetical protein [Pseudomonadota bacterium]